MKPRHVTHADAATRRARRALDAKNRQWLDRRPLPDRILDRPRRSAP